MSASISKSPWRQVIRDGVAASGMHDDRIARTSARCTTNWSTLGGLLDTYVMREQRGNAVAVGTHDESFS